MTNTPSDTNVPVDLAEDGGHVVWDQRYEWSDFGFETKQVHAGEIDEQSFGARVVPIYLTSAFRFRSFDQTRDRFSGADAGHVYSRHLNPTNVVAEQKVALLEGGTYGVSVGSGQAAISSTVLALARPGDHFVSTASIYSGTRVLFERTIGRLGISVDYIVDPDDAAEWRSKVRPETRFIFTETIPNPKNDVVDLELIAGIARDAGIPLVVDNTVATPYLCRPIEHGADIVVHSSTKFLTGHGAAISGIIVDGGRFDWRGAGDRYAIGALNGSLPSFAESFGDTAFGNFVRTVPVQDLGPALSPFNGFLLQQGVETLSLRVGRHAENSRTIAFWLDEQPQVQSVDYAGLPDHPRRALADKYFGGLTGSVFAFTLTGGEAAARIFIDRLEIFTRMTNIGDVRSMAIHPATTTHASFSDAERQQLGIDPGLVRLSVGIETVTDLIADLSNALAAVEAARV